VSINVPVFITCPKGIESLLLEELSQLGGEHLRQTVAGVSAEGDWAFIFRTCLWSRLANKVLLPIARFPISNADDLYAGAAEICWEDYLASSGTVWIEFNGTNAAVRKKSKMRWWTGCGLAPARARRWSNTRPMCGLTCA